MVKYLSPCDLHIHLRGTEYDTNYAQLAFEDARHVGLRVMAEMPNPLPQLVDANVIDNRFNELSKYAYGTFDGSRQLVRHMINIGLTNDIYQVRDALRLIMNNTRLVKADKVFYTHSTGNMGILDEDYQREIWKLKRDLGYKGVSMAHFEDEKSYVGEFDYMNPMSHSLKQCPEAELVQIERQIKNAIDFQFQGTFYVAHVSNPDTIKYLLPLKKKVDFEIIIEATWHHIFLNHDSYKTSGNLVKMNPPLRSKEMQAELLRHVLNGDVDIIGTDHAPHPLDKKINTSNPYSGIPALLFWPKGIELLMNLGINRMILNSLIFYTANRIFNLKIDPVEVEHHYQPDLWSRYGYNPFESIDL